MRALLLSICGVLLAGCVAVPRPLPDTRFLSPLSNVLYVPGVQNNPVYGKGVAVTLSEQRGCADAAAVGARWGYNWQQFRLACDGLLTLPMLWDTSGGACPVLGDGALTLLWNEPEWWTPPITPERAAELTRWVMACFPNRRYASPATISTDGAQGLVWLDAYWNALGNEERARIDVIAAHCYSWWSADACIARIGDLLAWSQARGRKLLITEFAVLPCQIGEAQAVTENDRLLHWIERQPGILGYAFFATHYVGYETWAFKPGDRCLTALVNRAGELTQLGTWYASH